MAISPGRRAGRRAGLVVFALLVTACTAVWSIQILMQVWAPSTPDTDISCRSGVTSLVVAVSRAREAAARETGGEREAMARFRAALEPEWAYRRVLSQRCHSDSVAMKALSEVDHYRYAEEHAVRYAASNLSRLRQRMETLQSTLETPR